MRGGPCALAVLLLFIAACMAPGCRGQALADEGADLKPGLSGLPLPRFVSISASKAFARAGPDFDYPVNWVFVRPGLPVEVIDEFEHWRRIRDHEDAGGWMHKQLLSSRRTALIAGEEQILRSEPSPEAAPVARLEQGVIGQLRSCAAAWCRLEVAGHRGWVRRSALWGTYPDEQWE